LLERKGQLGEALLEKQEAIRLNPDDSDLVHGLGVVLRVLGRFEESAAAFRKAVELNPANSYPLNALAWYLVTSPDRRRRHPQEALDLARIAVKEGLDVATYFNTLGLAEYRNGLYAQAILTLRKSIEMNKGTDPSDFFILAMTLRQRGKRSEAERNLERGVEIARKSPPEEWEWTMLWAEAAELLGNPGPVPTLQEVRAEPDRAMATLRRMAAAGYLQPEVARNNPQLAPLRSRSDFQLLMLDLDMPSRPFTP
jgi:tetratricopeptide (TPR) repeat protein